MILEAKSVSKIFPLTEGRKRRPPGPPSAEDQAEGEGVAALHDVSLTVSEGEFLCLLGPSGCGKSTFLNIVAGFEEPSSGSVLLRGKPVEGPGIERGVVFQEDALFPWLSVSKNVEFGLQMRGWSRKERERVAREFIQLVGLARFADMYPSQLSGGMKQRIAIARALANEPEILLMDEPFAALDIFTREMMQGELMRIWSGTKKTILFVTHSIEEAIALGDRIVVMTRAPAKVKAIVPIEGQRPRARDGALFLDLRRKTSDLIQDELRLPELAN